MGALSLTLPELLKPDKTEDPKVRTALSTIQTWANGTIDGANLESSVTGLRLIQRTNAYFNAGNAAGTYIATGLTFYKASEAKKGTVKFLKTELPPSFVNLNATQFAVSGATTKLTLKADIACNNVAPATKFTFGLYPTAGFAGGESEFEIVYGEAASGSQVTLEFSAAKEGATGSVELTFPGTQYYSLGVETNAEAKAKSITLCSIAIYASNT